MTKSYSRDLRRRVARFVEVDPSCHARHFEVSVAFVVRLMAAYRTTGSPAAKPKGGRRYSKLDPHRAFLIQRIAEKGDLTMPQRAAELAALGAKIMPLQCRAGSAARATPLLPNYVLPVPDKQHLIATLPPSHDRSCFLNLHGSTRIGIVRITLCVALRFQRQHP